MKDLILFPVEFLPLWWIWATHTLYANRFDTDDKPHRIATLAIMMLLVTLSGFPPFRVNLVINTIVCISITVASSFLPDIATVLGDQVKGTQEPAHAAAR